MLSGSHRPLWHVVCKTSVAIRQCIVMLTLVDHNNVHYMGTIRLVNRNTDGSTPVVLARRNIRRGERRQGEAETRRRGGGAGSPCCTWVQSARP